MDCPICGSEVETVDHLFLEMQVVLEAVVDSYVVVGCYECSKLQSYRLVKQLDWYVSFLS